MKYSSRDAKQWVIWLRCNKQIGFCTSFDGNQRLSNI